MKALFIGLGGIGQRHLRNLRALHPEAEIAAIRVRGRSFEIGDDLRPDHSVDIIDKYGITCLSDMDQALAWSPDLAIVANPSSLHVATAQPLLAAGIPVLLEKPIAGDADSAQSLLATARHSGTPIMVAFTLRLHPAVQTMLDWLQQGMVGRISSAQAICHNYLPHNHSYEPWTEFYLGRRDLGGGAILSETHTIDLVHAAFGLPRALWCRGGQLGRHACDVEDTATALLDYGFPVSLHVSMVERPVKRLLSIHGDEGCLSCDPLSGQTRFCGPGGDRLFDASSVTLASLYPLQMQVFLDMVQQRQPNLLSLDKVIGGQTLAAAMLESLVQGTIISCADPRP
jgi:predicted dehydrogenase